MNKNNLKVGTRVVFSPVNGSFAIAEGEIIKRYACGTMYIVHVAYGEGSGDNRGKDWACGPEDITCVEPTPGAWGPKPGLWGAK